MHGNVAAGSQIELGNSGIDEDDSHYIKMNP